MHYRLLTRVLIFVFILLFVLPLPCFAESIKTQLDNLFEKAQELSEKLSAASIMDMLTSNMISSIKQLSSSFFTVFAILTVCIIFQHIKDSFSENEALFEIISSSLLILSTAPVIKACFDTSSEHIEALCGYMLSFIPTAVFLYTASGCSLTAAITNVSAPFAVSALQVISASIILPLTKSICSLTCINSLCKKTNLSGFSSFLKSVCLWTMGLSFTLFTGILSIQSLLQSGLDSLTVKGIKYGAARLIPIAGGMVSESMRTVIESVSAIKSVTGIWGMVFIIYSVIPPICILLASKLYFSILASFAKSTSQSNAGLFLDAVAGILTVLLSLTIGISIAFIILFSIFIKTKITV